MITTTLSATPTLRQYLIVCPLIFLAGLIDSVAGGGGLISLPAYMAAGLPAHMALGTNKLSSTFGTLMSSIRYVRQGRANLRAAALSIVFALMGSALGARVVLYVDPQFLKYALLGAIPIIAVFVLRKKSFGAVSTTHLLSPLKVFLFSSLIGFVIGFYDGFFGPGTGTFLVLLYTGLLRCDLVTAAGNAKLVNLASNVAALATFIAGGVVNYRLGIPAMFCGIAGNYIGSGLALKKGAVIIRPMFIVALVLLVAYILNDLLGGG